MFEGIVVIEGDKIKLLLEKQIRVLSNICYILHVIAEIQRI